MRYVRLTDMFDPTEYLERLPELAPDLPAGARSFATDPDHYDFGGKRCVKDLALRGLAFDGTGLVVEFRHNCWKHEEDLTVRYGDVRSLAVDLPEATPTMPHAVTLDEILPDAAGCRHEIAMHTGSLVVTCRDLTATWTEADCPEKS
nr:hypothetical protein [Kibdelosporangium sp. MJ126-NF4]